MTVLFWQSNDALTAFSSNLKPWEIVFLRKAIEDIVERFVMMHYERLHRLILKWLFL